MRRRKLEAVIDALTDSLEIVAHNKIETNYVLSLIEKYKEHYKEITGRHYSRREVKDSYYNRWGIAPLVNKPR